MKKIVIAVLFFCSLFSTVAHAENKNIYPNEHWEHHDSPESIGFSSDKLDKIKKYIIEKMNTTGLIVVVGGKVLLQYGDIENTSYIASCRKSLPKQGVKPLASAMGI